MVAGSLVVVLGNAADAQLLRLQRFSASRHLQYPLCLQYRDHTSWVCITALTASISFQRTRLTRCQCLSPATCIYTSLGRGDLRENRLLLLHIRGCPRRNQIDVLL